MIMNALNDVFICFPYLIFSAIVGSEINCIGKEYILSTVNNEFTQTFQNSKHFNALHHFTEIRENTIVKLMVGKTKNLFKYY